MSTPNRWQRMTYPQRVAAAFVISFLAFAMCVLLAVTVWNPHRPVKTKVVHSVVSTTHTVAVPGPTVSVSGNAAVPSPTESTNKPNPSQNTPGNGSVVTKVVSGPTVATTKTVQSVPSQSTNPTPSQSNGAAEGVTCKLLDVLC